jgi:Flp pilus assembly protein TadG
VISRVRPRTTGRRGDAGSALIEFVLLGAAMLIPLLYFALAVSAVQRGAYGVTQAAQEAGRAFATGTAVDAAARARYAASVALDDQGFDGSDVTVRYAAPDADCSTATVDPPPLTPGLDLAVCVTATVTLPGVPRFLSGAANTVTGRYVVHTDEYRDLGGPALGDAV